MRCYFHLVNGHQMILDEVGVFVSDLEAAKSHALSAIDELRRERDSDADEDWRGWTLQVVCMDGKIRYSIDLTSADWD